MVVHWWSIAAIDTTMSTNELDGLRIGDLNLRQQVVTVPWPCAKNRFRKRSIALENADGLWAFDRLLARAHDLGARDPQHYLFPFGARGGHSYDPARHMTGSGLKRQWQEVRNQTGLHWVDRYGMRHTGATRMAEIGISPEIIMARMGHATDEMRQHYTQISLSAQRRALRGIYGTQQPHTQHMYAPPPQEWPRIHQPTPYQQPIPPMSSYREMPIWENPHASKKKA